MNSFEDLYEAFKKYMACFVVGNIHLINLLFHNFVGIILTKANIRIATNKMIAPRVSAFVVQNSGTSKGEATDALFNLLTHISMTLNLGLNLNRTTEITNAGLLGTIEPIHGVSMPITGALDKDDLILFPEGRKLFIETPHTAGIRNILNMALDEPGNVSKNLRLGRVSFESKSTLIATTFPIKEVNKSVVEEGFFPRLFVSYKEFGEKELNEIDRQMQDLRKIDYDVDVKPLMEQITELVNGLLQHLTSNLPARNDAFCLRFKKDDITKMESIRIALRQRFFRKQYTDSRKQVLESFYSRLRLLLDKIASHHAALEWKKEIDGEDYVYASEVAMWHCESVLNILDKLKSVEEDVEKRRTDAVVEIIHNRGGKVLRTEILRILDRMYIGRNWDLGKSRTKALLKKMVDKGLLKFELGPHGSKTYKLS